MTRKYGPKSVDHPSIGTQCAACGKPFKVGDYTALIELGPADDPEERKLASEGEIYNAACVEIHWDCSDQAYPPSLKRQLEKLRVFMRSVQENFPQ
jgi:hypothetical protein